MDVKTLTDSSIQAALARARDQLGEHVVLIESTPATEDAPAEITVMIDETARRPVPKPAEKTSGASSGRSAETTDAGPQEDGAFVTSSFGYDSAPEEEGRSSTPSFDAHLDSASGSAAGDHALGREETGRGRFFPASGTREGEAPSSTTREEMVEARLELLENRLGGLTQGRQNGMRARRWVAHPFFGRLLDEGMRPDTVASLFDELTERGLHPDRSSRDEVRWALAQVVCHNIQVASAPTLGHPHVFLGPAGAGKTSLLLKLATQGGGLNCRDPMVIHLLPDANRQSAYQNPTDLYRRFGLPVQGVRTKEEMANAMDRADEFGQVLIDTPPLPLPLGRASTVLRRFDRLLRPVRTRNVHFVLNATQALDSLDEEALAKSPIEPHAVAITHVDAAQTWGRMVEWLVGFDLPVQFISDGPSVPEGARAFSLRWFVQDVMDL